MAIIELFGLPGAGKTYLKEKLEKELHDRDVRVATREDIILHGLRCRDDGQVMRQIKKMPSSIWKRVIHEDYCLQEALDFFSEHPAFGFLVFSSLCSNEHQNHQHCRSILGAVFTTCIEYSLIDKAWLERRVLVADEWFCHRFHTIFGNFQIEVSQEQVCSYVKSIPESDVSIFISTPPEVCLERMATRGRFPHYMDSYSNLKKIKALKIGYNNFQKLTERLGNSGRNLIVYDGVIEELGEIIHRWLSNFPR